MQKISFKIFVLSFFILHSSFFIAQNLVNNPSFETYTACPTSSDQLKNAVGWTAFRDSPDYFNSCNTAGLGIPSNVAGYQNAFSGSAYAGFVAYCSAGFAREVLGSQLTQTLTIGSTYFVNFKISLAEFDATTQQFIPCNKIGVRFSTVACNTINPISINNFAHVYTNMIISDTMSWSTVSGSFVADSNYKYIMIGNFFNDANTDTVYRSNGVYSYFFVDEICVSTSSLTCPITTGLNEANKEEYISIYPNPSNDFLRINSSKKSIKEIIILNSLGLSVYHDSFTDTINISNIENGIYLVILKSDNYSFTKKIIINHTK
jgi:hypothetical protein